MKDGERLIGMGLAMVDEKIQDPSLVLPSHAELISFLDQQPNLVRGTGGVTANILTALTKFNPTLNAALLACTGNDIRGDYYRSRTDQQLGTLQINPKEPTGVVLSVLDNGGSVIYRDRHLGAAETVKANKDDVDQKNVLFVSDLTTIRLPQVFNQAEDILTSVAREGGSFFLNLAGLNPAITSKESIQLVLNALKKQPDIVTGNVSELAYLTGSNDMNNVIENEFPKARILVITMADKGSLVRFENRVINIPALAVPPEKVIDETGAGDTYAGIMLGVLYSKPFNEWTQEHILQACTMGTLGASIAVQSINSRLTDDEINFVKKAYSKYFEN